MTIYTEEMIGMNSREVHTVSIDEMHLDDEALGPCAYTFHIQHPDETITRSGRTYRSQHLALIAAREVVCQEDA